MLDALRTNVFTLVGGLIAIAGVVVLAIGAFAGAGAIMTGIFLLPFGLIFFSVGRRVGKWMGASPDVLEHGVEGTATVTRMWETGVTVNEQPVLGYELEVDVAGEAPFTAETQQLTPRMLTGAVLPGSRVGVRWDRASGDLAIDFSQAPEPPTSAAAPQVEDLAAAVAAIPSERRGSADALLASGRKATARITSTQDVGKTLGELGMAERTSEKWDDSLMLFGLDVKVPGRQVYSMQVMHFVPDDLVGRIGPGLEVPVAVSRDDPEHDVAIDWAGWRAQT
jgi:hypothetical protein